MFCWGSYNFQTPILAEHPNRPVLKYPVYAPIPSKVKRSVGEQHPSSAQDANTHQEIGTDPSQNTSSQVRVDRVVCGQKHAVVVLHFPSAPTPKVEESDATGVSGVSCGGTKRLFGLGSNAYGQLGNRVPEYSTSLASLHFEDVAATEDVLSIACGQRHTLICTANGCVYAAGDNTNGQLGNPIIGNLASSANAKGAKRNAFGVESDMSATLGSAHGFTQVTANLAHIVRVFAGHATSYALDKHGRVFSWGSAASGSLGHGDNGEAIDPQTLKTVTVDITVPKVIEWFSRKHVIIEDLSAGKSHFVARSSQGDVYTCGEGFFGKLGNGDVDMKCQPLRVQFPQRQQTEKVVEIAAGDDHTLVLKQNPVIGSVLYFFGKLPNGDGQLTPLIIEVPSNTKSILAGRGTLSFLTTDDGYLYVWGKHSYPRMSNCTAAGVARHRPQLVELLEPFVVDSVSCGGVFALCTASAVRDVTERRIEVAEGIQRRWRMQGGADSNVKEETESPGGVEVPPACVEEHLWDIMVDHDERDAARGPAGSVPEDVYDDAVSAFLLQYLGETDGRAYLKNVPESEEATAKTVYQFTRKSAHALEKGDKVRVWMTDIYALGTIASSGVPTQEEEEESEEEEGEEEEEEGGAAHDVENKDESQLSTHKKRPRVATGTTYLVEWERDDWKSEQVTLFSDDETMDEENPNRWQPFWFERKPGASGYSLPEH